MEELGFVCSLSATYLRCLPVRMTSFEGRRHPHALNIKVKRAQNVARQVHPDSEHAKATVSWVKKAAVTLGPKAVIFISEDDKAKVPLGSTATVRQVRLLMRLDHQVETPDHDFGPGRCVCLFVSLLIHPPSRHKLTPSVYAECEITKHHVSYRGPTTVRIRSMKHDVSNAATHLEDICEILDKKLESQKVVMLCADGGADQGVRHPKVVSTLMKLFLKYDLDAVIKVCYAPRDSAYNICERRMTILTTSIAGTVLKLEEEDENGRVLHCHLNSSGKTISKVNERLNFKAAGELLARIWSAKEYSGHPIDAKWVDSPPLEEGEEERDVEDVDDEEGEELDVEEETAGSSSAPTNPKTDIDGQKYTDHVQQGRYFCAVMKCDDLSCCSRPTTNLRSILGGGRFFPVPRPVTQTEAGCVWGKTGDKEYPNLTTAVLLEQAGKFEENFDKFRPQFLPCQVCPHCGISIPSPLLREVHAEAAHGGGKKRKSGKIQRTKVGGKWSKVGTGQGRRMEADEVWDTDQASDGSGDDDVYTGLLGPATAEV